jgi:DNA-binding transcriptional regulator LsrR (DeoR family)
MEEALVPTFGLRDAIVADCVRGDDDESVARDVGRAAAYYLETTLNEGECIGISSWCGTILAMVDVMRQIPRPIDARVIQILGGAGEPQAKVHAAYLASRLAELVRGKVTFLPVPGLVDSADVRQVLLSETSISEVIKSFDEITLALVGIGTVEPFLCWPAVATYSRMRSWICSARRARWVTSSTGSLISRGNPYRRRSPSV